MKKANFVDQNFLSKISFDMEQQNEAYNAPNAQKKNV